MDIRQSQNYAKYMQSIGWQIEKLPGCNVFVRHLPIISFFSVIKIQRPEKIDLPAIKSISRKHHAIFVSLEPNNKVRPCSARSHLSESNWPLLPTKTIILNTRIKFEALPKDTRYEIRKGKTLQVEKSTDIGLFYQMLEETMKIGHWSVPIKKEVIALWQAFQPNNSQILLIPNLAACLIIWQGGTAHYMFAALTKLGRKTSAAYKLLWETMQFLLDKKINQLDLEGIYDERFKSHTKNWQGFTKFKQGWNGTEVSYPGSYCVNKFSII